MAYKVDYSMITNDISSNQMGVKRRGRYIKWIILCLVVAFFVVCATTDILIPGDATVTKAAMSNFVSDIRSGEQVVDAFAAFCQTVLQGG